MEVLSPGLFEVTTCDLKHLVDRILVIRGQRVMLDSDLAHLYDVETKVLNRAVRRNINRFPDDFMFQLTADETEILRCQIGTSRSDEHGGRRYRPYAFTEQGVAMLSSVLRSPQASVANETDQDHRLCRYFEYKARTAILIPGIAISRGVA